MQHSLPKTKAESIARLQKEAYQIQPDQDFEIRLFEPEDAWAVARCFYEVYGEHYPIDTYYVPEKLIAATQSGDMIVGLAHAASGDVVAFGSLFRNVAANSRLFETGQATVVPSYRSTLAVLGIQGYLYSEAESGDGIDVLFGEAVCHHLVMQKVSSAFDFIDTGIEVCLMPSETYRKGDATGQRISTVLTFKVMRDTQREVFLPTEYETILRQIISGLPLTRTVQRSSADIPSASVSELEVRNFDQMQAVRVFAKTLGQDFEARMDEELAKAAAKGTVVFQTMVNLGQPWAGKAVTSLRRRGFRFGGFLPVWFGADGLLMHKLEVTPDFAQINILKPNTREILEFIRQDMASVAKA